MAIIEHCDAEDCINIGENGKCKLESVQITDIYECDSYSYNDDFEEDEETN